MQDEFYKIVVTLAEYRPDGALSSNGTVELCLSGSRDDVRKRLAEGALAALEYAMDRPAYLSKTGAHDAA